MKMEQIIEMPRADDPSFKADRNNVEPNLPSLPGTINGNLSIPEFMHFSEDQA
jgi:hypothetical protein